MANAPARDDKDYRKEMEELIRSEGGKRETSVSREISDQGESATQLRTEVEEKQELRTDETNMLKYLTEEQGLQFVSLEDYPRPSMNILRLIPAQMARDYKVFPIRFESDGSLLIAISDPLNIHIVDDLRLFLDKNITPVVCPEDEIIDYIDLHYGIGDETIEKMVEEMEQEADEEVLQTDSSEVDLSDLEKTASAPPVIKLVNLLLLQAIKDRASDIHVEPFTNGLRIRYRVDGVLREIPSPPRSLQLGVTSRFKVLSGMNIAERRLPQDGRIKLNVSGREVDLRVSTVPTVHGESVVMRVLDKSMMMLGISQIGLTQEVLDDYKKILKRPNGIVLVTGPTGCGKTTTLYAALSEINDPGDKIITTEEPVEYELSGLLQINVNQKVGLTFARCLRSILRHDPDIILVGEIRDLETAQISIQAALTGHLVFSTLHTNSASATVTRLADMGVEPFLITSTLEAVLGQRLVRTVCPNCQEEYIPTDEDLLDFGVVRDEVDDITFYKGAGCNECAYTGYKGRMGIFELLEISDMIRDLVLEHSSADRVHAQAVKEGMKTMRQDGWLKICLGLTTFEEITRQTPKEEAVQIKAEMDKILKPDATKEPVQIAAPGSVEKAPAPSSAGTEQTPWQGEEAIPSIKSGDASKAKE